MQSRNVSDIIERYLKEILAESRQVEIKRSEVAERFDVVPSQINYVIKTRFTVQDGYLVESKRGGGGYIRIEKVDLVNDTQIIDQLIEMVGDRLSSVDALHIVQTLYENKLLSRKEGNLLLTVMGHDALNVGDRMVEAAVRARMMIALLNRLRCVD
ncbi:MULTISPECIES: CtsR family transcriptional regulator [unclassified Ligilactobacillus]|uniref:CtsR family transcriptional regulator n=1 Tax=unclassified Ligilactobacillus TaxID=2767920 RepID=UPI003851855A